MSIVDRRPAPCRALNRGTFSPRNAGIGGFRFRNCSTSGPSNSCPGTDIACSSAIRSSAAAVDRTTGCSKTRPGPSSNESDTAESGNRTADATVEPSAPTSRNEPPGSNTTRPPGSIFTRVSGPNTRCPRPAPSTSACNCRSRPPDSGATPHDNATSNARCAFSGPATADNNRSHPDGPTCTRRYCPGSPGFSCHSVNPAARPAASFTECISIEYESAGAAPAANPATALSARSDRTSSGDGNNVPTRLPSPVTHGRISTPVRSSSPSTSNAE
ncbi:hypothetical protein GCM10009565_52940 [Amycolatopsis albidoflavus]